MIDVASVLQAMPTCNAFCSVEALQAQVDSLRRDSNGFTAEVVGRSAQGNPIHHIRFGRGALKALFVGYPHCNEPIGGLTISSLLAVLGQAQHPLQGADIEWHFVPCIDPDGALLNEGWSLHPFTLENYMRNVHRQELRDQVECSFPIRHKRLQFDQPTQEARVLQRLLEEIKPDFYYPLHNAYAGGAFFCLSRNIDCRYHTQLQGLLTEHGIPLQTNPPNQGWSEVFGAGIYENARIKNLYDFLERTTPFPEQVLQTGACSYEYLAEIKPSAMTFATELPYLIHPSDGSQKPTGQNLRHLKLQVDADNKFIATLILDAWETVRSDLNTASAFYKKIANGVIAAREQLPEALPQWPQKTRDILYNADYDRVASEGERFNVYLFDRFYVLCNLYEFARLLRVSQPTAALLRVQSRLEAAFETAFREFAQNVDLHRFTVIDCNTLARVQLASGLIVLNALLAERYQTTPARPPAPSSSY